MNIISKSEALSKGERYYFTGTPCKRGHITWRYVSTGNCSECLAQSRGQQVIERRHAAHKETLVSISFRAYDTDWPMLEQTARALCEAEYPGQRITIMAGVRGRTSGTAFYTARVPAKYAQVLADTADALRNTHRVDVQAMMALVDARLSAFVPT